jgi:uncharacterized LabA/DUF88 family protein
LRVAILIDWQNAYQQARNAFELEEKSQTRGIISPLALGRLLVDRQPRALRAELAVVEVHRGLPDARRQKRANAATLRHRDAWIAEDPRIVIPRLRPLAYNPETAKPEEKGIDVALAVSAVEWIASNEDCLVVIFSHDSDLLPAVETIARVWGSSLIQTASWWSRNYWKRIRTTEDVKNHALDLEAFRSIERAVDYRP